ncbi:MAG TPA: UDP-2,4-diacetamido-2,4,6-trideoxy-beta-L-altropyranose hydrolase [Caulobacteraceae bacterium]|nr:UDP-2,4-diacetamido-2,4,6-trideoxy-beta-L-altropyranose hydrolase [Caulobacteraceae bacterium]
MSGKRILFLPAYGPAIGGGHAFRCFTLAQALVQRGASCGVAMDADAARALHGFRPDGVEGLQRGDALPTARGFKADLVVIDDYGSDADNEAHLVEAGVQVAIIDDLANRRHDCSLLVDPGFGRAARDYAGLVPQVATVLAGPDYALLRPEFAKARPAALNRRKGAFGHRALVSLGLTDVGGITAKVTQLLAGLVPMTVVLGADAPSLDAVRALPGVTMHLDARDMAGLIAAADIGIGGGGVGVWERACLGLPSILIVLADNQAAMARALDDVGVVIAIDAREDGFEPRLVAAVERLFSDEELRCRLTQGAAHLCDGLGAGRVADAIIAKLG